MQVNVDINPEEVNRQVAAAIINSALGERLQSEIDKRMKEIVGDGYYQTGVIGQVVDEEVRGAIRKILMSDEYNEKIKSMVRLYMTEKLTAEVLSGALDRLWNRMFN
jgi:negative regulator of replication initiation